MIGIAEARGHAAGSDLLIWAVEMRLASSKNMMGRQIFKIAESFSSEVAPSNIRRDGVKIPKPLLS